MALTDNGNGLIMPVAPMGYGYGNGFGGFGGWGDDAWIILILLFAMGGWGGFGGFGGFGGGLGIDFPWILNGQQGINANTNAGFNQAATAGQLSSIQSAISNGFANAEVADCNRAMNAQATAYNNQIASMNQNFANQQALDSRLDSMTLAQQECCCENRAQTADLKYTVATEAAATRAANTAETQKVLDKLCQLELDGVKSDLAAERRENLALQNQLNMAAFRADNVAQTAQLVADNTAQTQYIVNRVAPYPIPAYPVSNPFGCNGYNGYGNYGFGF